MKNSLILIILFITGKLATAQSAATNTGILYINSSSDTFYVGSDFANNAGSALTNKGQLYIKGNLTNNEVNMAISTGTLYLNGTSAQSVNGGQQFRTYNFVSNNASGITLNNNLSVSGAHTFTSGIITTSATPNYLVYEAGSSYSGDADTRHVNGWVKKFGSTNFVFPVGNGTYERTIALNSLSASSEFNARHLQTAPNTNAMQLPIRDVDDWEYWLITKVSGGTATVTMNWDRSKIYFPNWIVPDIVATEYNGSLWTDQGGTATGNPATTGTITSNAITTFNYFTFGSKSWILPLSLTSFTASKKDNGVLVEWKTEKEINVKHFIIERSEDGTNFRSIAQVNARNSGNTETYQSTDNTPINSIAYYRLGSVDIDGKEILSRIVTVVASTGNDKLLLTSNPVRNNKITLLATGQLTGDFNYQITTINGQMIQKGKLTIHNGGYYEINTDGKLKPGTYSLQVTDGKQGFYYKILTL